LTPPTTIQVPETKHVRDVLAKADEVGLELVEVSHERGFGVETLKFRRDGYRLDVSFDKRGYIRSAGGNAPDANSWVISVSGSRRFGCSPARALDVLVNFTMPRYARGR
jgi:hypothetical protein